MTYFSLTQQCALLKRITQAADLGALLDLLGREIEALALADGYIVSLLDPSGDNIYSAKSRLTPEFRYLEKTYLGYKTSLKGEVKNLNVRAFNSRSIERINLDDELEDEKQILTRWKVEECAAMPLLDMDDENAAPIGVLLLIKQQGSIAEQAFAVVNELASFFIAPLCAAMAAADLLAFRERFKNAADEHARALEFIIEVNNLTEHEKILDRYAAELFRLMGFECIGFFLLEDDVLKNKKVVCADARHQDIRDAWSAYVRERHYALDGRDGGVSHAFLKNSSLMFHDVQELLHIPMSEKDAQTMQILKTPRTLLVLPIRYQNKPIGCITFFSISKPIAVPDTDLRLLKKLSAFLGTAIINGNNFALSQAQNIALQRMATHDALTGLANRALLRDRLLQGLARWQRRQQTATIAFIDLDHFKVINDTLGHSAGDRALVTIAGKLQSCLRQSDTIARFGGDEFVLILEDPDNSKNHEHVLRRILAVLAEPIKEQGQEFVVSCSIGYSCYPLDGEDPDTLLNAADAAMYLAKQLGRSNIQAYMPDMRIQALERLTLESKLRHAVENNELILDYQPKADMQTGCIVGVEALVRWRHPEHGLVAPGVFIPIAEESGLIVPIGDWILRTACAQALAWAQAGIGLPVAVNLSARQFQSPGIASRVKDILETIGLDARYLELELTESMSMGNPEKSIEIMQAFRALGITLTLDDFGTGYSNLSYLKRFPLDKLKLDQSFVRDITQSPEALAISQAVLSVAHSLHLKVVAEGVETAEQLQLLAENGCEEVQGYYFSRPLSAEDCTRFLQEDRRLHMAAAA